MSEVETLTKSHNILLYSNMFHAWISSSFGQTTEKRYFLTVSTVTDANRRWSVTPDQSSSSFLSVFVCGHRWYKRKRLQQSVLKYYLLLLTGQVAGMVLLARSTFRQRLDKCWVQTFIFLNLTPLQAQALRAVAALHLCNSSLNLGHDNHPWGWVNFLLGWERRQIRVSTPHGLWGAPVWSAKVMNICLLGWGLGVSVVNDCFYMHITTVITCSHCSLMNVFDCRNFLLVVWVLLSQTIRKRYSAPKFLAKSGAFNYAQVVFCSVQWMWTIWQGLHFYIITTMVARIFLQQQNLLQQNSNIKKRSRINYSPM